MRAWLRAAVGGVVATCIVAGCSPSSDETAPELPATLQSAATGEPTKLCNETGTECVTGKDAEGGRWPKDPSAKLQSLVADKRLTRDEYESAFGDFQACLADGGLELTGVDTTATYIAYVAGVGGLWDECYEVHYSMADAFWQLYEEPRTDDAPAIKKYISCLDDAGVDHPAWKIPESRRDKAFLYDEVEEFVRGADAAGLLSAEESRVCFSVDEAG